MATATTQRGAQSSTNQTARTLTAADVLAIRDALAPEVARLVAEQLAAPRRPSRAVVLAAIARVVEHRAFTAGEVVDHAHLDRALWSVLSAARIGDARARQVPAPH